MLHANPVLRSPPPEWKTDYSLSANNVCSREIHSMMMCRTGYHLHIVAVNTLIDNALDQARDGQVNDESPAPGTVSETRLRRQ